VRVGVLDAAARCRFAPPAIRWQSGSGLPPSKASRNFEARFKLRRRFP